MTPNVTLDWNSSTSGYFETVQDYGTSYRAEAVTKYFHSGATYPVTSPEELSTSSFTYDEAGRVHTTGSSYDGGQTVEPVDLYPDGSAHRRYIPYDSNATINWSVYDDNYSFTDLDAFDRVEYTGEQDGATALVRNRTIYHDATGWVTETQSARYHEADATTVTYKTEFEHDVLGRVIETRPFGTDTSAAHVDYTHFDGMGRVFETQRKNVAGTEGGVISNSFYNFAGQRTKELRGMSVTTGLFARTEWDYDLAGRRLEETRYDGGTSVSRTRSWTYDDLDRIALITHPPQSTGTLDTDYEYGFDSVTGLPFTEQEDPVGVVLRTERNELGHRLHEEVVSWGTSDQVGPAEVRLTYGGASGCGCTSVSKPTVIETIGENYDLVSSGDNFDTKVTRTFSPRGNILSDEIEVTQTSGGTLNRTMLSTFSFDAAGRKTEIHYPDPPGTLTGMELEYTHRQDGLVRTIALDPDGVGGAAKRTIGEYEYEGSQEILRELRDMASGTQATVATVETARDALGRLSEKEFTIGTNGGGPSSPFTDGVDSRTLDGQVEIHAQPPVSGLTNGYSKFEYGGAGWIVHQAWNASSSAATDSEHTQSYTRNGFGEIESMDDVETTPGCGTGTDPMYDETVAYGRDLAGNLKSLGLQGLTWSSAEVYTPSLAYTPVIWTGRSFTYDLNGRLKARAGTRTFRQPCREGCDNPPSVQGYQLRVDQYEWDHYLDAWGRRVLTDRTSTLGAGSEIDSTCAGDPPVADDPIQIADTGPNRVHLYVRDGLGRLVYSTTPSSPDSDTMVGFFHAYDGSTLLATHDVGSGNDSFIEFFNNPTSGTTDKYRIHRDGSGPNGVTGSAGPGWSSTSTTNYGTNLHGIWNNVILSNGAGQEMGGGGLPFQDEGVFPTFTRLFLASGEEVVPADPFSWLEDGDVFDPRGGGEQKKADEGQSGGVLLEGIRATSFVTMSAKSYIARLDPSDPSEVGRTTGRATQAELQKLAENTASMFDEDPQTDDPTESSSLSSPGHRLFSAAKVRAHCNGGLNLIAMYSTSGGSHDPQRGEHLKGSGEFKPFVAWNVGKERAPSELIPPVQASGEVSSATYHVTDSKAVLIWKFRGKPHEGAEVFGFPPRRPRYIWHVATATIECDGSVPTYSFEISGSRFPSHRSWLRTVRGVATGPTLPQGPISELLQSDRGTPEEVR